jgi:3-methylfumaryl-CoA hydratase
MNEEATPRVTPDDITRWRTHIGRQKIQREMVDANVVTRFALATGAREAIERTEPPLAHWAFFLDPVANDRLGEDGHPRRGDFLPPVHLPRRMFAATSIHFGESLELGAFAECTARVTDVSHKAGRSGDLVFVELQRTISQGSRLCIDEKQTIVYRTAGERVPAVVESPAPKAGAERWVPGPVDLFRFSAVTFNAHRIHYDQRYAREVEGYPDLVVHGPFTAVKLLAHARRSSDRKLSRLSVRILAPLFVSQPVSLVSDAEVGCYAAIRCDGTRAVTAQAEFE